MKYRTSAAAGGLLHGRILRTSHSTTPMFNHDVTDNLDQRKADLQELIAAVARHALDTNALLTPKQKAELRDVERGRYSDKLLRVLVEAMAGAQNAKKFADAIWGATLQHIAHPALCVVHTYLDNTRKQAEADVSQSLFLIERTEARRDQLLDTLGPELATLESHRAAVLAWNPKGRRTFA